MSAPRRDRGAVAAELAGAVALLLVPVVLLVVALPRWSERQHAAVAAAEAAARVAADAFPADGTSAAREAGRAVAANHGIGASEVTVRLTSSGERGGAVTATVTVAMPALLVPGLGSVGGWSWTTSHTVRIDDYRSR